MARSRKSRGSAVVDTPDSSEAVEESPEGGDSSLVPPDQTFDPSSTANTNGSVSANTINKESKKMSLFTQVDETELAEVAANTRAKGEYDQAISDFLNAGIKSAKIVSGEGGKAAKVGSIKAGLESAKERAVKADENSDAKHLEFRVYKDAVYIARNDL